MKRRDFLAASCAAGLAPLSGAARAAAAPAVQKEYLELRLYKVGSEARRKRAPGQVIGTGA